MPGAQCQDCYCVPGIVMMKLQEGYFDFPTYCYKGVLTGEVCVNARCGRES